MQVWKLTTPIAFITASTAFRDPLKKGKNYTDERSFLYEYMNKEYFTDPAAGSWFERTYGNWRIVCSGPDGWVFNSGIQGPDGKPAFHTISYDPTNGTISIGDIYRTSKDPDLKKTF